MVHGIAFQKAMKRKTLRHAISGILIVLWAGLICFGSRKLLNYESTPGTAAAAPAQWPAASRMVRPHDKFTLVMLTHPNCPCTRASVAELEILMARLPGQLAGFMVFRKPEASAAEVKASDLWKTARRIPNVSPVYDEDGAETERFGGQVSGQTMLYDPNGRLVFSGGITSARGHQGDNAGVDAVILCVREGANVRAHVPVFGCSLHDPDAKELSQNSWKKQ